MMIGVKLGVQIEAKSFEIFIEQIDLVLLLSKGRKPFGFSFHILNMPFSLRVHSLIVSCRKYCTLSTLCAFNYFLLDLHLLFNSLLEFLCLFRFLLNLSFLFFLLQLIDKLKCTKLLIFQAFIFLINDDSHQNFNNNFVYLLTGLIDFSIFAWFDIIYSDYLGSFNLFFLELINLQFLQPFLQLLCDIFFKGDSYLHFSSSYLVSLLQELYAFQSLPFSWLVKFQREVDILNGKFYILMSKSPLCDRMHTFLNNNLHDICQDIALLGLSLFICNLQLTPLQNDLDYLSLCLVSEELVQISLFGQGSMGSIFINLLNLQNF